MLTSRSWQHIIQSYVIAKCSLFQECNVKRKKASISTSAEKTFDKILHQFLINMDSMEYLFNMINYNKISEPHFCTVFYYFAISKNFKAENTWKSHVV